MHFGVFKLFPTLLLFWIRDARSLPPPLFRRVDRVTTKRATPSSSVNKMCVLFLSVLYTSMISRREKTHAKRKRPKEEELFLEFFLSIQTFFRFL